MDPLLKAGDVGTAQATALSNLCGSWTKSGSKTNSEPPHRIRLMDASNTFGRHLLLRANAILEQIEYQ